MLGGDACLAAHGCFSLHTVECIVMITYCSVPDACNVVVHVVRHAVAWRQLRLDWMTNKAQRPQPCWTHKQTLLHRLTFVTRSTLWGCCICSLHFYYGPFVSPSSEESTYVHNWPRTLAECHRLLQNRFITTLMFSLTFVQTCKKELPNAPLFAFMAIQTDVATKHPVCDLLARCTHVAPIS